MKNFNLTLDIISPEMVEAQTTSKFDFKELYNPYNCTHCGGEVFIIAADTNRYILPAKFGCDLPKGEIMEAVILCNSYEIEGRKINFNKLVGIRALAVDINGCNNYHVVPVFRDDEPAVIPPVMVQEFVELKAIA